MTARHPQDKVAGAKVRPPGVFLQVGSKDTSCVHALEIAARKWQLMSRQTFYIGILAVKMTGLIRCKSEGLLCNSLCQCSAVVYSVLSAVLSTILLSVSVCSPKCSPKCNVKCSRKCNVKCSTKCNVKCSTKCNVKYSTKGSVKYNAKVQSCSLCIRLVVCAL